ncbi:MAG: hypothetical protein WKG03_12955 [Telluria sp.]
MPVISAEVSELRAAVGSLASANEQALAACAGHNFAPTNPYLRTSNHVCSVCRGVVAFDVAAACMMKAAA